MLTIPSLSTTYVKAAVAATISGVTVDPTGDDVSVAFMAAGVRPAVEDFAAGSWETATADGRTTYYARRLADLDVGRYDVWVMVEHAPETIVLPSGPLAVV